MSMSLYQEIKILIPTIVTYSGERRYRSWSVFPSHIGINKRSILCNLPYFNITKCLLYDIMHTLFEGVVPHCLKNMW